MNLVRQLWPYLRRERAPLFLAYACMVVLAASSAFYTFLIGPAFKFMFSGDLADIFHGSGGELRGLWEMVPRTWIDQALALPIERAVLVLPLIVVLSALIKGIAYTGQHYLLGQTSQRVLRSLRADAFAALLRQPAAFFSKRAHGDLVSRLTNDAQVVEQAVFYGCAPIVRESLAVLAQIGVCLLISPKLAAFTFGVVPLSILPLARFSRWLKRVSRRGQSRQGDLNAVAYEALAGVRVVQAFGTEHHEAARLDEAAERYYREMLHSYFIRAVRSPTMELLGALALGSLFGVLGYQVRLHGADPAQYVSFFAALLVLYDPLKKLGAVTDHLAMGTAAMERIVEIKDRVPEVRDATQARTLPRFSREARFEQVSFDYGHESVLQGVDLTIASGEVVALVGASGSGKTTLAGLLPRFYDVCGGRVTLDGTDIREVTLHSLRAQISVVSQDTFLFNTSVRANIAYGVPSASDSAVAAAAEAAYAHEFIDRLPQKYDTIIGERGVTLSGGQRQRLAIARAFLRDSPILILDEATSSLDVESERFVQQALEGLMRARTCLVIAHRLSTVRRAHLIAVLKNGVIVERGRHDDLITLGGEYARLHALQFQDERPAQAVAT